MEADERELVEHASAEQEGVRRAVYVELQQANIAAAETLLDDLIKDDPELNRIRLLPGVQTVLDEYVPRPLVPLPPPLVLMAPSSPGHQSPRLLP